ncbi:MAG TPA: GNAT family N-acetyltransferase [Bacillus bacterium]|nr:GNAT family N-acetyltransferase [Bacillus sp. (in: firmicutes)]
MSNLGYRKIRTSDYSRVKELINEAFKLDHYTSNPNMLDIVLEMYLRGCLLEQTYTEVVEENGEVIGLLFGKVNEKNHVLKNAPHLWALFICRVKLLFTNKKEKASLHDYKKITNSYSHLIKECHDHFDGEVVLFIVGEKCRGKGIGKTLMKHYLNFCKGKEIKSLYLFTDTKCNYGFYENNGFIRRGQKLININTINGPSDLGVYLYSYRMNEK